MEYLVGLDGWSTLFCCDAGDNTENRPMVEAVKRLGYNGDPVEAVEAFEYEITQYNPRKHSDPLLPVARCLGLDVSPEELSHAKRFWNWERILNTRPYDDTFEVLDELRDDYKLALISNTDRDSLQYLKDNYGIDDYFDMIVASCEVGCKKPGTEIFQIALKSLGLRPEYAVMVGNSHGYDISPARELGMSGVLIDRYDIYSNNDVDCPRITSLRELDGHLPEPI